jgi:hypothetical protein
LPVISKNQHLSQKIIGIVEDTENGHQKYEKYIAQSTIPVFSVARSQQKKTEDYNVGKSIVNTADMLLKNIQIRSEEMVCGVIGFGKIGSSIADHLRQKRVRQLLVYDHDPVVLMRAASLDFLAVSKADILEKCTMIYCATGQKSLSQKDLEEIGNLEVFIASCTSSDDEFDCEVNRFEKIALNPGLVSKTDMSVYRTRKHHKINFLANGNAINFYLQNNALGNYIRGVQGAILVASLKILNESQFVQTAIHEINYVEEKVISQLWLKYFNKTSCNSANRFLTQTQKTQKFIRETDIQQIEEILHAKHYCCVYGRNGIGKTEIIRKLAKKNEEHYELILYIDETNSASTYKDIAKRININLTSKNQEELLHEIFSKLIFEKNFFIIFDNISENSRIKEIVAIFRSTLSKKHATRNPAENNEFLSNLVCLSSGKVEDPPHLALHEILPLTLEDIQTMVEADMEASSEMLFELSAGHPFLLDKIFSYLESTSEDIAVYHKHINEELGGNIRDSQLSGLQRVVVKYSVQKLIAWKEGQVPLAYELLMFCALLDGELIQPELLSTFFSKELGVTNDATLSYAIDLLVRYGFVEKCETNGAKSSPFYMRRLTQDLILDLFLNAELSKYIFYALRTISGYFNYSPYEKQKNLQKCYDYISHAHIIIKNLIQHPNISRFYQSLEEEKLFQIAEFLYQLGSIHLYEYRDYDMSLIYYKEIERLLETTLKPGSDPDNRRARFTILATNGIIINQSHAWKKERKNQTAELGALLTRLKQLEDHQIKYFSPQDTTSLFVKFDIAINKAYIQKYLGCRRLDNNDFRGGVELLVECLKNLHAVESEITTINTNESSANREIIDKTLALTYHALGSLYVLLHKHRSVYSVISEVGVSSLLESAEKYLKQAKESRENTLNSKHPDLARTLYKYSEVLWKKYKKESTTSNGQQPKLLEALSYCKAAISAQEKHLLPDHINLQYSKELKRKIKTHLNQKTRDDSYNSFFTTPWTPKSEHSVPRRSSVPSSKAANKHRSFNQSMADIEHEKNVRDEAEHAPVKPS